MITTMNPPFKRRRKSLLSKTDDNRVVRPLHLRYIDAAFRDAALASANKLNQPENLLSDSYDLVLDQQIVDAAIPSLVTEIAIDAALRELYAPRIKPAENKTQLGFTQLPSVHNHGDYKSR